MTTIIDTVQASVTSRPSQDAAAVADNTGKTSGDSFSQVLKDPETRKTVQPESKKPLKSADNKSEKAVVNNQQPSETAEADNQQENLRMDVEPINDEALDTLEDDESAIELTSEALLHLVSEGQKELPVILVNAIKEAKDAIIVPTKAEKSGNILPVIGPKQPLVATEAAMIQSKFTGANELNSVKVVQPIEAISDDVVLIKPGVKRTSEIGILMPIEPVVRQKVITEFDSGQNKFGIQKDFSQINPNSASNNELEFSKLNLSELINKESALNNDTALKSAENLADIRTESRLDTRSELNQVASASTSNLTTTTSAVQKTETSHLTFMMQTAYKPGSREWSESFTRNIAMMSLNNNKSAEIRMDPPDLGSIQVKIHHLANETNLQFQVQHNDTKQAIEASIQRLKESLAEQGFVNVNVDIQHGEQQTDSNSNEADKDSGLFATNLTSQSIIEDGNIAILQPLVNSGIDFFA